MVPPVPIPNTVVKRASADDTWWATAWENRSSPGLSHLEAGCIAAGLFCLPALAASAQPDRLHVRQFGAEHPLGHFPKARGGAGRVQLVPRRVVAVLQPVNLDDQACGRRRCRG